MKLFFILFSIIISFSINANERLMLIISNESYSDKKHQESFKRISRIILESKHKNIFLVYDGSYNRLKHINVDKIYENHRNNKLMKNAYLKKIMSMGKNMNKYSPKNKPESLFKTLDFLGRKSREFNNMPNKEAIIYSDINDDFLPKNVSDITANLAYIDNNLPFPAKRINLNNTNIHIIHNDKPNSYNACEFWKHLIKRANGRLASCQSNSLDRRINNPSSFDADLSKEEIEEAQKPSALQSTAVDNDTTKTLDHNLTTLIKKDSTDNVKNTHYSFPLKITLEWKGKDTDLDLSIWSDEGDLYFNSIKTIFGNFKKNSNQSEEINLKRLPKNSSLRIVHSNSSSPNEVKLRLSSEEKNDIINLSGYFLKKAEWRKCEISIQYLLKDIMTGNAFKAIKKDKIQNCD